MHAKNKNDKNIAGEIVSFFRFSFGTIITGQFAVVIIPLLLLWEVVPRLHLFFQGTCFPPLVIVHQPSNICCSIQILWAILG